MKCTTPYCSRKTTKPRDKRMNPYCAECRWKLDMKIVTNVPRDYHRMFIKPSKRELEDAYYEVDKYALKLGRSFSEQQRHQLAYCNFEVDHIDGNHKNNHPSNLQTLSLHGHKKKSIINKDQDSWKNKRRLAA